MENDLSMDLRFPFKRLIDVYMRAADAGRALLLSTATAAQWRNKVRNGASLAPRCLGPRCLGPRKSIGKLNSFVHLFVRRIEQDPDITLAELQAALLVAYEVT
jgi:hypothetical protein